MKENIRLISVTLSNGQTTVTNAKFITTKSHTEVGEQSVLDLFNYCSAHNIPLQNTWLSVDNASRIILKELIYETHDEVKSRLEHNLKEDYKEYLRLKEKFKDM